MRVCLHGCPLVLAMSFALGACGTDGDEPGIGGAFAGSGVVGGAPAGGVPAPAGAGGTLAAGTGAAAAGSSAGSPAGAGGLGGTSGSGGSPAGSGGGASGSGASGSGGRNAAGNGGAAGQVAIPTEPFSFFVTSMDAMLELAGSDQGFGGDLRFGEATGLAGADKICATIAEMSLPGASGKQWRAFLSASSGAPGGGPVHAKDRIGAGPWYDRMGRVVAMNLAGLLQTRPSGADPLIANDLPNEHGEPNHQGVDNHDTVTASNQSGEYDGGETCDDWTMAPALDPGDGAGGFGGGEHNGPGVGHSWPAMSGMSWIAAHRSGGCAAGVNLTQNGGGSGNGIGAGGGYGGFYCFALAP